MKKYNKLYIKYIAAFSFGIGMPITFLLVIVALISDSFNLKSFLFSILPLAAALIVSIYPFLRISYLKKILEIQEKYGFIFDDSGAKPIYKKSLIYISDDWIIISGRLAFHKQFIKRIVMRKEIQNNTQGCPYALLFECINGEIYRYKLTSYSDGKKIKEWFN